MDKIKVTSLLGYGIFEENSFVITETGENVSAIVDPGFETLPKELEDFNIKYILLTHAHIDHIFYAKKLADKTGAKIVIGKYDEKALSDENLNLSSLFGQRLSFSADIVLNDLEEIEFAKFKIQALHTPGHTVGSCCYIVEDHMFTGDTIMAGTVGRTDLPTGDTSAQRQSLEKLKNIQKDYILYCGHGPNSTLSKEKASNAYLR